MGWIKELASGNMDWNYEDKLYTVVKKQQIILNNGNTVSFNFKTKAMYNDYYGKHIAYISNNIKDGSSITINYSGETECMCCGQAFDYYPDANEYFRNEESVVCLNCEGLVQCAECGMWLNAEDAWISPDGIPYCNWCVEDKIKTCDCCGETKWIEADFTKQELPYSFEITTPNKKHSAWVGNYKEFIICDDCYFDYGFGNVPKKIEEVWKDTLKIDIKDVNKKILNTFIQNDEIEAKEKMLREKWPEDYI